MKRILIPLVLLAFTLTALAQSGGTVKSVNDTNELVMLNPRSANTNVLVHAMPWLSSSFWTWHEGDATPADTNHLDSVLYPGLGRWVWNNIGTNYFQTLVVSNLIAGGDSLWTNKSGILQPQNLTLPVMITNQLQFGPGATNVLYRDGNDLVYTNGAAGPSLKVLAGTGTGARVYAATGGGRAMLQAIGLAGAGLGVDGNSDGVVFQGSAFIPIRDNTTSLSGPTSSTWFKDIGSAGTNYVSAFKDATATNYDRLAIYGTPTALVFDSQALTNDLTAPALPFSFRTNGIELFTITGTGGPSRAANWVGVGATDSTLAGTANAAELYTGSFKLYRGALTPVDAGVSLDFGSTNRYWSITLTGNVTFATANLAAGKHANVMITGVATNATYTWPAGWIFIGYKPTYLTANKHADLYLKSTSGADAGVWAYYGEEQ